MSMQHESHRVLDIMRYATATGKLPPFTHSLSPTRRQLDLEILFNALERRGNQHVAEFDVSLGHLKRCWVEDAVKYRACGAG